MRIVFMSRRGKGYWTFFTVQQTAGPNRGRVGLSKAALKQPRFRTQT